MTGAASQAPRDPDRMAAATPIPFLRWSTTPLRVGVVMRGMESDGHGSRRE